MFNYTINICGIPTEEAPNDPGPLLATCELVDCPVDLIPPDPFSNSPIVQNSMVIPLYGSIGVGIYVWNNPLHEQP
jgi:hypothetical protein